MADGRLILEEYDPRAYSEEEELAWVAELPPATRDRYSSIVADAAESGVRAAVYVTQFVLLLCLLLALLLPATKLED